ncbi:MAG: 3-phosphoshikimate 1-carboxyvinyltransferase [Bacteroidales bacterium]
MTIVLSPKGERKAERHKVKLSGSKSISNRVLIINAIADNFHYPIANLADCDDTNSMLNILNSNTNRFDVGHAGTTMRFLTAYLSGMFGEWIITGSGRMKQRPINLLVDALRELGADIEYLENEGYPPLKIKGRKLVGKEIGINGDVSSQYISALLMIAPRIVGGLTIKLHGELMSLPYIDMTIRLMQDFGIDCTRNENVLTVSEGSYQCKPYAVEGDWSSASYWFSAVALSEFPFSVELSPLFKDSLQGDSQVIDIFKQLGVEIKWVDDKTLIIQRMGKPIVDKLQLDLRRTPDIAQTLAVCSCALGLPFEFTGLETLKIKETDRTTALVKELAKCGYSLKVPSHGSLTWNGIKSETANVPIISTYNDHRMAMAFAVLGIRNEIIIEDEHVVSKSYDKFWKDLEPIVNQIEI